MYFLEGVLLSPSEIPCQAAQTFSEIPCQALDALFGIDPDDFQLNNKTTAFSTALVMETLLDDFQKKGITRAQCRHMESTEQDSTKFYVLRVLTDAQAYNMDLISNNAVVDLTLAMPRLQKVFQQHHVIWLQLYLASEGSNGTLYAIRGLTDAQALHMDVKDLSDADHEPTGSDDDDASS